MRYLTMDEVLAIHEAIIDAAPPDAPRHTGVRHLGGVAAALERCQWGPFHVGDREERAALLLRGLCQDHPFEDGNKRTAIVAADTFLRLNGKAISATYVEGEIFIFAVARGELDVESIAEWLRTHVTNV